MSDFSASWSLCRQRLLDEISGMSQAQLNWQIHENSLSIGQMVLHVAGVEVSFSSQLAGIELDEFGVMLKRSATEGVVNDLPFPYSNDEITPELIEKAFAVAKEMVQPLIESASPEIRTKEIKSALGPVITGEGAFARLGFHASYHHGQSYLIKTAPGFPSI